MNIIDNAIGSILGLAYEYDSFGIYDITTYLVTKKLNKLNFDELYKYNIDNEKEQLKQIKELIKKGYKPTSEWTKLTNEKTKKLKK